MACILNAAFKWSVVAERSSSDSSTGVVRKPECGFDSRSRHLCPLSKTLNHNCFVLRMARKAVGPVCCVMHIKEPSTLIVKRRGLPRCFWLGWLQIAPHFQSALSVIKFDRYRRYTSLHYHYSKCPTCTCILHKFCSSMYSTADQIKPCPRCTALIIKMDDGSCNHMSCAVCGAGILLAVHEGDIRSTLSQVRQIRFDPRRQCRCVPYRAVFVHHAVPMHY